MVLFNVNAAVMLYLVHSWVFVNLLENLNSAQFS